MSVSASESYRRRIGEMVEATVIAQGRQGEWLLKLDDGAFACLPEEESIPGKRYSQGDRVCAIVVEVEEKTWAADKRAPVVVSTAIAGLLAEVFKAEIPEVANGDIVIKSVARVSGKLSKVAVARRGGAEEDARIRCRRASASRTSACATSASVWAERSARCWRGATTARRSSRRRSSPRRWNASSSDSTRRNSASGEKRRLDKFVAYVNRFDEAKAIGVGG